MKLPALVHALALGASSAFVGLVSQRSLAPTHAVTHAVRPRPLHRQRDTIKAGIPGSGYVRNMRKQMDAMVAGRGKKAKGSGGAAAPRRRHSGLASKGESPGWCRAAALNLPAAP